jgi:uroporphyrinogen decarboxylase
VTGAQRFLSACARRPVDRTPVWLMRQAGRYLPEYRAVRERVDFWTLCTTPDLAVEVSLQPVERFGTDACIVFSDILVVVAAMGAKVAFTEEGPRLEDPVRTERDVRRLRTFDPASDTGFVLETLRRLRRELGERAALVGFCGGPLTLAAYLTEGGGSKNFLRLKDLLYRSPTTAHELLATLADACAAYAAAQVRAGAQAVQIFDTWAGELTPQAYEEFALPYQRRIVDAVRQAGAPVIVYVNGCAGILELMARSGADVLSVDWRIDLSAARARLGSGVCLQGNVDPAILTTTVEAVRKAAAAALRAAGPLGHILNLGHGVLPQTPPECVRAFVGAVQSPSLLTNEG